MLFRSKTDDSSDKVVAESLDQAVKKIKEQIEVVQKETKPSDQQKIRVKALQDAIRQLENTSRKTKTLTQVAGKKEELRLAVVNRVGKIEEIRNAILTPEKKAEIDKAASKVKELTAALRDKQKELAEAQLILTKLQHSLHAGIGAVKIAPQVELRVREITAKPPTAAAIEKRLVAKRDADSDKTRLEELEKKLDKLLDEVATLKKDRAK